MYERMLAEHDRLQLQINSLQEQLSTFPDGKLVCSHNGKYQKWYQSNGSTQTYIPKKARYLAEQLAEKKYLSLSLDNLLHEQKATELYLNYHTKHVKHHNQLLEAISEYTEFFPSYSASRSQTAISWATSPYNRNKNYPEQLIYKTSSGNLVRSKSESVIDMFLYLNKIPFRYECALQLGETTVFPDFTICHPLTNELFYWEHFGLVDDPRYCKNMLSKLQLYTSQGIFPSIQLITTYETKEHPLSPKLVEELVKYYFL